VLAGEFGELRRPLRRSAGRMLLVDPAGQILLIRSQEAGEVNWVCPGGGVENGESTASAAVRELAEETGLAVRLPPDAVPVHCERAVFGFANYLLDQTDDYYLVRWSVPAAETEVRPSRLSELELSTISEFRWLTADEIRVLPDPAWPDGLADLLDTVVAAAGTTAGGPSSSG
jgi:8-oxo-dGTP pyrophosphatase MutT (NUDIX family)